MKICIVGLGLIGGSFARAIRENTAHTVFSEDRSPETLAAALEEGVIDGVCDGDTPADADLICLALYPEAAIRYLEEHAEHIRRGAIVFDVCGVKGCVCAPCEAIAEAHGFTFIGAHPMAGTQYSGFAHSRATLFNGASMILCPKEGEDEAAVQTLSEFCLSLGFARICLATPEEHDHMIAYTSQLAHVVSNAYVKSPQALKHRGFSAGSFRDLTRVARLNADMWTELFLDNRSCLIEEIDTIIENLKVYRDALEEGDADRLHAALEEGTRLKIESEKIIR